MQQVGVADPLDMRALDDLQGLLDTRWNRCGSARTRSSRQQIHDGTRKILTIEEPIEYQVEGITQMQVQPRIGLTFARAAAIRRGMRTLAMDGVEKVRRGMTTLEEVARVAQVE